MDFESLKEEYLHCCRCPELCANRRQVVFGSGRKDADLLLIGEAPGANEDREGVPFCGMSGKILDELLESVSLSRDDIFITNTVLCRPPNNRDPTTAEMDNCKERLDKLIEIIDPKVIVTIGNFATERMIKKRGIRSIQGKIFHADICGRRRSVVPVIHPASYLYSGRDPMMLKQMKEDFSVIAKIIEERNMQKSLGEF